MMQTNAILLEAFAFELRIAFANPNRGPGADVVAKIRAVVDLGHAKLRQQTGVECAGFVELADCQDNVSHSVDVDHWLFLCHVVVIALPRDLTASARPAEGGMLSPRSQAGRARSWSIQRSR